MARDDLTLDPLGNLGLACNPDGSFIRVSVFPESPASSDLSNPFHLSKDIPVNQSKNTWVRIFVPRKAFDSFPTKKLPIIIYFHGGGFILCSAASSMFDDLYTAMVTEIPAVVVSVDYRSAPEHRLPAAYDDCMEALHWIKVCVDEWLFKYGDFSKCFLMGTSSGGNICYHVGLRAAQLADDLKPLQIKGLILHQAFFGGNRRSGSELRLANNKLAPIVCLDLLWELCLPIGADRDHPFCNPMVGIKSGLFDHIKAQGFKVLVTGYDGDPLFDRQVELMKKLEEHGVAVVGKFNEGGHHACDIVEPELKKLCDVVEEFISSSFSSP